MVILALAVQLMWSFPFPENSSSDSECESDGEGSTCSSSSDSDIFDVIAEIKRKKAHPDRMHEELWYNDPGQVSQMLGHYVPFTHIIKNME